jgi:hypothetical protein
MMPPRDKVNKQSNYWYWVWLIYLVWIAMEISAGQIITAIALLIIGGLLTIIGQAIKRRIARLFAPKEQLCDVLFENTDKAGNKVVERNMQILASEDCQIIHMYLQSMNPKEITGLKVRFGIKKTYARKFLDILVNRRRMKRLWALSFSPNWWADFRMPTLVKDEYCPQIRRIIDVHLQNEIEVGPIVIDGEGSIWFDNPIRIPVGIPFGTEPQIQIDLEIIAPNKWRGTIQCESSIGGVKQFTTRKVRVNK